MCVIDNYDSFTFNLVASIKKTNIVCDVYRNDNNFLLSDEIMDYDGFVISPGPSNPSNSGLSMKLLSRIAEQKPVFGVCLGMQIINEFFGGSTIKAPFPVHGKTCRIQVLDRDVIFKDVPENPMVARYHSLICSDVHHPLLITAVFNQIPMALKHQILPIYGVQFHPESFMTPEGDTMIRNFIEVVRGSED
ncbi:MAG: aminodeoxychorismate/anthranilate synthase component II [Calditrichia bacterium]